MNCRDVIKECKHNPGAFAFQPGTVYKGHVRCTQPCDKEHTCCYLCDDEEFCGGPNVAESEFVRFVKRKALKEAMNDPNLLF